MSIDDVVKSLCERGELDPYEVVPSRETISPARKLYLSRDILPCLDCLQGDPENYPEECGDPEKWWTVETDLMDFVDGELLNVRRQSYTYDPGVSAHMVRLLPRRIDEPEDIWELRIVGTDPPVRLFGAFTKKDRFVALTWRDRPDLDYGEEMKECARIWDDLLGANTRLKGRLPNAYLSTARLVPPRDPSSA
jgi:hypothetical protein